MQRLCLIVLLVCAACTPTRDGLALRSDITGIIGAVSRQIAVSSHPHFVLVAQAMVVRDGPETAYLLEFGQAWDGVNRRLRIDEVWSDGQQVPFSGTSRHEPFCTGTNCNGMRLGVVGYSREGFAAATQTGMDLHLIGPDATIFARIPGDLFAEAIARAAGAGIN